MDVLCPSCGSLQQGEKQYCADCGKQVLNACPSCRTLQPLTSTFCADCGTAMPAATVMAGTPTVQASAAGGFCSSCGAAQAPGATFCPACGNRLGADGAPTIQAPWASAGSAAAATPPIVGGKAPKARRTTLMAAPKKGLAAVGTVVVAGVILAAVAILIGGSDSGGTSVEARDLLQPAQFQSSSQEMSAMIASLNRAQLQTADLTMPGKTPSAKEVDDNLKEVSAQAMRTAELASGLAETAQSQVRAGGGSTVSTKDIEQAAAMAEQYEAIARSAYLQVLELQNLRQQYALGLIPLAQVTITIVDYGARMWNPGVVIAGTLGNPFINYYAPLGFTPLVSITINSAPAAVTTVTTQLGGGAIEMWVARSATTYTRTVTVNMGPYVNVYDPFDVQLARRLETADGMSDWDLARRVALAKLDRYRQSSGLGWSSFTAPTDPATGGPYVNFVSPQDLGMTPLYALGEAGGVLTLQVPVEGGIAVAGAAQVQSGILPSFEKGRVTALFNKAGGSAQDLVLLGLNGDGPLEILGQTELITAKPVASLQAKVVGEAPAGSMDKEVTLQVAWQTNVLPLSIYCYLANTVTVSQATGTTTIKGIVRGHLGGVGARPTATVTCHGSSNNQTYAVAAVVIAFDDASPQEVAKKQAEAQAWATATTKKLNDEVATAEANRQQAAAEQKAAGEALAEAERQMQEAAAAMAASATQPSRPAGQAQQSSTGQGSSQQTQQQAAPPPPPAQGAAPLPTNTPPATLFVKQLYASGTMGITTPSWSSGKVLASSRQWQLCISGSMTGWLNTDHTKTPVPLGPGVFNVGGHITGAPTISTSTGCVTFTGQNAPVVISCGHFSATSGSFSFQVYDLGPL